VGVLGINGVRERDDRLQVSFFHALVEALGLAVVRLKSAAHVIESLRKLRELVLALDLDPDAELTLSNLQGGHGELLDRPRQLPGEQKGQDDCGDHRPGNPPNDAAPYPGDLAVRRGNRLLPDDAPDDLRDEHVRGHHPLVTAVELLNPYAG